MNLLHFYTQGSLVKGQDVKSSCCLQLYCFLCKWRAFLIHFTFSIPKPPPRSIIISISLRFSISMNLVQEHLSSAPIWSLMYHISISLHFFLFSRLAQGQLSSTPQRSLKYNINTISLRVLRKGFALSSLLLSCCISVGLHHIIWLFSASPLWAVWCKFRAQRNANLVVTSRPLRGSLRGGRNAFHFMYISCREEVMNEAKKT